MKVFNKVSITDTDFSNFGELITTRDKTIRTTISFAIAHYLVGLERSNELTAGVIIRIIDNINQVGLVDDAQIKDLMGKIKNAQMAFLNPSFRAMPTLSSDDITGVSIIGKSVMIAVDGNIKVYNRVVNEIAKFEFLKDVEQ